MNDAGMAGVVQGLMLAAIGLVATLIWKIARSPSEGARRLRMLFKLGGIAAVVMLILAAPPADKPLLIGMAVVIAAGIWVYKGYTKK